MKGNSKAIMILVALAGLVFGITLLVITLTQNAGKPDYQISEENATEIMDRLYRRIQIKELPPVRGNAELSEVDLREELPDIDDKYPPLVRANSDAFIELLSSVEKATDSANDRWLLDMAEAFNRSGAVVGGKSASVQLRGIASGAGMDYILSGKFVPDAFTPSNELWGDSLVASGIKAVLAEKSLTGNVAGLMLKREKHDEIVSKYGSISVKTIIDAVTAGELNFGYTNPFSSSTGANFLLSALYTISPNDPFSSDAASAFGAFQANIPFVAYTTLQMKEAAKSGALDGFVFSAQQLTSAPEFRDYIFTPFGERADNPVYAMGDISAEGREILDLFIAFCKKGDSQDSATKLGFNQYSGYICELSGFSGKDLATAQKFYKEKKNYGRDIIAVFIADISGSMGGAPIMQLKQSLLKASTYIDSNTQIGLVTFSENVNIALPIAPFDINQRSLFAGAVADMTEGGATAMFDAIVVASKMLQDAKAENPNAKTLLFVLTDGETNVGATLNDTRAMISGLKTPIYTIGYNEGSSILPELSLINEAASINADTDDVVYQLQCLFNAEM
ncbi:MAG: VWA domain-containing protein [Oscillospiraceae bacterium]|nr:VWA domain-containing protein [Oscillospiraceae bacterium]